MKPIKYKISEKEDVGLIPYNSIINCFLMYQDVDRDDCLIYTPKHVSYIDPDGVAGIDVGCGSLSFAKKSPTDDYYVKSSADFINLKLKDEKIIKNLIKD